MENDAYKPSPALMEYLRSIYVLDWERGVHGIQHWERVLINGLLIADANGANQRVVSYFAYLHDICRRDDGTDHQHGKRASDLIRGVLQQRFLQLPARELDLLTYACEFHTDGMLDADITVQACWDADRLDIGRVGISINNDYLGCVISRDPVFQRSAFQRSISD